jgi:hypothetical protein
MRRREFTKAFVGSLVAWPFAAHAQVRKLPIIGFLGRHSEPSRDVGPTQFGLFVQDDNE